jgi:hypothetical protein
VTLRQRLQALAPGLTPRLLLEKLAAVRASSTEPAVPSQQHRSEVPGTSTIIY